MVRVRFLEFSEERVELGLSRGLSPGLSARHPEATLKLLPSPLPSNNNFLAQEVRAQDQKLNEECDEILFSFQWPMSIALKRRTLIQTDPPQHYACVEVGLGQIAELLAARAEMRMSCAFRKSKYKQQGWRVKHETGKGEMEKYDTYANTFLQTL